MKNFRIGDKVQITNGIDTGKIATVVPTREIKLNGRGIPTNCVSGEYKKPDWSKEIPLKLPSGGYIIISKRFIKNVVGENLDLNSRLTRLEESIFGESSTIHTGLKIKGATSIDNRYIGNYLRTTDYTFDFDESSKCWLVSVYENYLDEIQIEFEDAFEEENINATITYI